MLLTIAWRLGGQKPALDAVVGPELAYVLNAREVGNGSFSVNGVWSTDVSRPPASRLDFRLRGDLTVWRNQVGLMANFSTAFANCQPAIILVTSPDDSVHLARLGLAYRFN